RRWEVHEPHARPTWPRRTFPLLFVVFCWTFLPLPFAPGQAVRIGPTDGSEPRARFGSVKAVDDNMGPAAPGASQQPNNDSKKTKPSVADKDGGVLLYAMPVTPPNPDQLFRLDSEEVFRDRLRTEVRQRSP